MKNHLKSLVFVLTFFCFQLSYSQNIQISGTVVDDIVELPIEAATAYLTLKKDSSIVDFSLTNSEGKFKLNVKEIKEAVVFYVSDDLNGEFQREFPNLTESIDLGTIQLKPLISLDGITITAAPIRIKNDTLEFNASSFRVRPDANVEELLKQLPGVEIDEEGKISVNGKEVNQILVNGKPFFDKDGKIAMQNLPAEIINKVQVTDTKTKKEELANEKASSNNATINLTIDESKNKGIMLKAMGGYGTRDRYESSFMLNYFKGDARISVLGSSNNINSVGFSMNEIFDNMGGGRNTSMWRGGSGNFSVNGIRFGGGNGITQSYLGGLNYTDSFNKNIEFSGNYFYTKTDTENNNYTKIENLLPNRTFITESNTFTESHNDNHNLGFNFEVKIDSTSSIWIEPKYKFNQSKTASTFDKFTVNENNELLNESFGNNLDEVKSHEFSNQINYFKSFRNKSQLSLNFTNTNNQNLSKNFNISNTYFFQSDEDDDLRNQFSTNKTFEDNFTFDASYQFNISDSLRLGFGTDYSIKNREHSKKTLDYDLFTNDYTAENEFLSSEISSDFHKVKPYLSLSLRKNKIFFRLSAGAQFMNQINKGFYMNTDYRLRLNEATPSISFNTNYKINDRSSIYLNYSYNTSFASAEQLLPIENLSNPLFTRMGNPDLKTAKEHSIYLGLNNYNYQSRTGYSVYFGGNYEQGAIVDYRIVDENFKTTATYANVDGNYSFWGWLNINKSFNMGNHRLRIGGSLSGSHGFRQGFIDGLKYESKNYNLRPRINLNWDWNKILIVNPSYSLAYQLSDYKNYRIDKSDNVQHIFRLETTNYWPKNFVFGNDFSYTYNSNISNGFKKDFFLWNTSLAYNFWNDKLTFKVKVYDVLGQNVGSQRFISENTISDTENDVLKRYVMFSLGFKLDQFGGNKRSSRRTIILD